jgi:pimeloyl-ACP methyl ester carboxylesterase/DNA-binding CsgD family transcriptional regulator
MEQQIGYAQIPEGTVAYATCGEGPTIVFGPRWVSHLEEEWNDPEIRSFFQEVGRTHTVVRFDRIGCGLSTRELQAPPTVEGESRQMEAVIRAVGAPVVVFATSCCGLSVSTLVIRAPELVEKIVFFGAYASRSDIPDATRQSVVEFTRTNWPLAAQMLMGLFDPHASGDEIARYARMQRAAASAEVASMLLELDLTADLREKLPNVHTPSLVLHRRGDRTVPIGRGRELAALLPNARFVPIAGDAHMPWREDRKEIMRALAGFLHAETADVDDSSPLTSRETEVLRLVATGMSNREIAGTLVLSEHTVHRHVANILGKLSLSSRAAAAAQATRLGLI